MLTQIIAAIGEFTTALRLHYGPGPHPDGSAQQVHGGGQLGFDFDAPAQPTPVAPVPPRGPLPIGKWRRLNAEDPRTPPRVGDAVYNYTAGAFGAEAVLNGTVVRRRNGEPGVKLESGNSLFGGQRMTGMTDLTPAWTKRGEAHPVTQQRAAIQRREDAYNAAYAARERQVVEQIVASKAAGNTHLDQVTPVPGLRTRDIRTGQLGRVTEFNTSWPDTVFVAADEDVAQGMTAGRGTRRAEMIFVPE